MANQQESSVGRDGNGERSGFSAKSQQAADQAKDAVKGQVEQARQRAQSAREQTAERLRRLADELRRAGETLQPRDELIGGLAQRASRGVEGVAGYVSSAELQRLRHDTERFARSRPAVFFGGAFLAGLALGRFFRSSAPAAEGMPALHEGNPRRSMEVPRPEPLPAIIPTPPRESGVS